MGAIRSRRGAGWLLAGLALLAAMRDGHLNAQAPGGVPELAMVPALSDASGRRVTFGGVRDRHPGRDLWLVRVQAAWCGTCLWHARWTPQLVETRGDGLLVIDVVIADEDNGNATTRTLAGWRDLTGTAAEVLAGRPDVLAAFFPAPSPLPRMLVVDPRTLSIVATLANPSPGEVIEALDRATANGAVASRRTTDLVDGRFSRDQWALVQAMRMPERPPLDPTNHVADDATAATFGEQLFFDNSLSPHARSCASCHDHELLFTNGKDIASEGVGTGSRNVPTILAASHARAQLWDGRAATLWQQALLPYEDPAEIGSSRLFVAHGVARHHRSTYEEIFGPMPALDDQRRFPIAGGPGTPIWAQMATDDREAVTRVFENVGKSIAAFERGLRLVPTALDRYAGGEFGALTDTQKDGLSAFFEAGCAQCHFGPRLSNDAFHNLRFPTGRPDRQPDRGRGAIVNAPHLEGAFKTPGLRGVPFTMPYGHGGGFGGLRSVIDAHRTGGLAMTSRFATGPAEPWAQGFDPALTPEIVEFLQVLESRVLR